VSTETEEYREQKNNRRSTPLKKHQNDLSSALLKLLQNLWLTGEAARLPLERTLQESPHLANI
jgi:hypothetical protein